MQQDSHAYTELCASHHDAAAELLGTAVAAYGVVPSSGLGSPVVAWAPVRGAGAPLSPG